MSASDQESPVHIKRYILQLYVDIYPICILVKCVVFISQTITLFKVTEITVEAIEMVETIEMVTATEEIQPEIQMEPGGGRQTDLSVMTQI